MACERQDSTSKQLSIKEELATLPQRVNPDKSFFLSSSRLAKMEDSWKSWFMTSSRQYEYAKRLLESGHVRKAIKILEKLEAKDSKDISIDYTLAIAYLRLGERLNCFSFHNQESCVLPLRGRGLYMDQHATRKAIKILAEIHEYPHIEEPVRSQIKWLLNISYMAIGSWPDEVPYHLRIDSSLLTSALKIPEFTDKAVSAGVASQSLSGGAIMDDFNNDGWLDIITSNFAIDGQLKYFENQRNGTFADKTDKAGLTGQFGGLNIVQTDYNNDGHLDIFVTRGAWYGAKNGRLTPNSLLKNMGNGTFEDVTHESGLYSRFPTQVAIWEDINLDGWLDLYIGNEGFGLSENPIIDELYLNNGDGTFRNIASSAGLTDYFYVKGATWIDYDQDRDADLLVSYWNPETTGVTLYKNKFIETGKILFEKTNNILGLDTIQIPRYFSCWSWDYDQDGLEDILVNNYGIWKNSMPSEIDLQSGTLCLKNNGDGTFTNGSSELKLHNAKYTMGSNYGDVNNDGFLDFYLGTGAPPFEAIIPNRLFINNQAEEFIDVTMSARVGHIQKGHGIAFGDYDNDGDQDIFAQLGGAFEDDTFQDALYANPGNANHWVSIQLIGESSNRAAIGSRLSISVLDGDRRRAIHRKVSSGSSFGGNSLRLEIGIGQATHVDTLKVFWPASNISQELYNIPADKFYCLKESDQFIVQVPPAM